MSNRRILKCGVNIAIFCAEDVYTVRAAGPVFKPVEGVLDCEAVKVGECKAWYMLLPGQAMWTNYAAVMYPLLQVLEVTKPGATHEIAVFAIDPKYSSSKDIFSNILPTELIRNRVEPVNYITQIVGNNQTPEEILDKVVSAFVVDGFPVEPQGITINSMTAREYWKQFVQN